MIRVGKKKGGEFSCFVPNDVLFSGLWIRQNYCAIFSLIISAPGEERTRGKVVMETWFETRELGVVFETMAGSLSVTPKVLDFGDVLPDAIHKKPLFATSSYRKNVSGKEIFLFSFFVFE